MKARLVKAWPIAASVAMLLAAFPPFNFGLLVFVALVPWLLSLREASGWGAARSGFLFGFLYMFGQLVWIEPFVARWTQSVPLAIVPWVLGAVVVAPFFAFAGWLIRMCWTSGLVWLIPLAWAGMEVARSYCPLLAFPWGLTAMPLWPYTPLIQGAYYGTVYLVSAWVVLVSLLVAHFVAGNGFREIRMPLLVAALLFGVSVVRSGTQPEGKRTVISIGQPGVDLAFGGPSVAPKLAASVQVLIDDARRQEAALLVLPEGVTGGVGSFPPAIPFQVDPKVPVVFGGQRGQSPRYQSTFAFDGKWQYADKTRLVIFGEYVPGRNWIPFLSSFNLPGGDLTAGEEVRSLDVGGIRVGSLLCFEALFHDVAQEHAKNGAQLLAVMAIDDWYMGTNAPEQLMAASVWRAVETGLPLVRSASLGYSVAIDARGNLLSRAPLGQMQSVRVELDIPEKPDRFALVNVFPVAALVSPLFVVGWCLWSRRRHMVTPI